VSFAEVPGVGGAAVGEHVGGVGVDGVRDVGQGQAVFHGEGIFGDELTGVGAEDGCAYDAAAAIG